MRALLVVNPNATTTSPRTRDVLAAALANEVELEIAHTKRRGHATELAKAAAAEGVDVVVSLGGDGTINEIVNGFLAAHADDDEPADGLGIAAPLLGVVPGGSTNVFGRALGLPRDPVDATGALLEALRESRSRSVGLGRVNGRWFTFCAGFGIDASVVRRVERARRRGKKSTPGLYLRQATAQFLNDAFSGVFPKTAKPPTIAIDGLPGGQQPTNVRWAIVQNTAPWTYLGSRAIHASPEASFDAGLDLVGVASMALHRGVLSGARFLLGSAPAGSHIVSVHDAHRFTLQSSEPLAVQLDGEYVGEESELVFRAASHALRVAV